MNRTAHSRKWIPGLCIALVMSSACFCEETISEEPAWSPSAQPEEVKGVAFEQNLNGQLPLDAKFRDEEGRMVTLGDYFKDRPVVLTLVYYECPMLCSLVLNGVTDALRDIPFEMGKDYEVVTISFDHEETHVLAADKKRNYLEKYGREGGGKGWHFLVGEESEIRKVTGAVGFDFTYDPRSDEFGHASGFTVSTPGGRLSHYFYGIEYPAKDVRLSLVEASEGGIGSAVDQLLLFCYHYDPVTGKYGMVINNVIKLACFTTVALLGCTIGGFMVREHRHKSAKEAGAQ